MHILLTNDDGIFAPGIRALCEAANTAGHTVSVCAPDVERSAASHSITLRRGMRARPVELPGAAAAWAVDGAPADCARLGLWLCRDVDAVLSGINNGPNMGGACVYSGTVSAAIEASMSGKPALAVSSCAYGEQDYAAAAAWAMRVLDWMGGHPLPRGDAYNLNVPALQTAQIRGIRAAELAPTYLDDPFYIETEDAGGTLYSYKHGEDSVRVMPEDSDVALTREGWAALSVVTWRMGWAAQLNDSL